MACWHGRRAEARVYRICVEGHLDQTWHDLFGLSVSNAPSGTATLCGCLADQAALHGVLARIRDLDLALVSVETDTACE